MPSAEMLFPRMGSKRCKGDMLQTTHVGLLYDEIEHEDLHHIANSFQKLYCLIW